MRLINKKTGEIKDANEVVVMKEDDGVLYKYHSLAQLYEDWEDYEEPSKTIWQIKDSGELQDFEEDVFSDGYIESSKSIGNYFETKEEAEKAVEKLKAWKRLKDKGISFEIKVIDRKWYLEAKADPQQRTFDESHDLFKDMMIVFGGEE